MMVKIQRFVNVVHHKKDQIEAIKASDSTADYAVNYGR